MSTADPPYARYQPDGPSTRELSSLTRLTALHLACRDPVRGSRPGRTVALTEAELKYLCTASREILLAQPMLLEL